MSRGGSTLSRRESPKSGRITGEHRNSVKLLTQSRITTPLTRNSRVCLRLARNLLSTQEIQAGRFQGSRTGARAVGPERWMLRASTSTATACRLLGNTRNTGSTQIRTQFLSHSAFFSLFPAPTGSPRTFAGEEHPGCCVGTRAWG
jgi:hypothetical protein